MHPTPASLRFTPPHRYTKFVLIPCFVAMFCLATWAHAYNLGDRVGTRFTDRGCTKGAYMVINAGDYDNVYTQTRATSIKMDEEFLFYSDLFCKLNERVAPKGACAAFPDGKDILCAKMRGQKGP